MNLGISEVTLAVVDRSLIPFAYGNIRKDGENSIVKSNRHRKHPMQRDVRLGFLQLLERILPIPAGTCLCGQLERLIGSLGHNSSVDDSSRADRSPHLRP